MLSSLMILSDPIGLEKSFAGPPGNKQQLHLASLNPKGKIMGFKAIRDHSTPQGNFLTYSMFKQGQTERWGPCVRALRAGPLLAVQLSRASLELEELRAAPLLYWPWTQPGLMPLPVGPAFKLSPFHQAPSELKLLLCCSHACPCLWTIALDLDPDLELTSSLASDLSFQQEPAWCSQAVPDPCSPHWTCHAWLTGELWHCWDSCPASCVGVLSFQLTSPCREPALAASWKAVPLKIFTAFKDWWSQQKC